MSLLALPLPYTLAGHSTALFSRCPSQSQLELVSVIPLSSSLLPSVVRISIYSVEVSGLTDTSPKSAVAFTSFRFLEHTDGMVLRRFGGLG